MKNDALTARGKIKRSYWKLVWSTTDQTENPIREEVAISCEIELMNDDSKELITELESISGKKW